MCRMVAGVRAEGVGWLGNADKLSQMLTIADRDVGGLKTMILHLTVYSNLT